MPAKPNILRWQSAVQYQWTCTECLEDKTCAVIPLRGTDRKLRLCKTCFEDGFWKTRDRYS